MSTQQLVETNDNNQQDDRNDDPNAPWSYVKFDTSIVSVKITV